MQDGGSQQSGMRGDAYPNGQVDLTGGSVSMANASGPPLWPWQGGVEPLVAMEAARRHGGGYAMENGGSSASMTMNSPGGRMGAGGGVRGGGGGGTTGQDVSDEGLQETLSEEVFAKYESADLMSGACTHPGDIVEAAPLAAVPLPKATYNLSASIPEEIIVKGKLSRLQLEGIMYACQRHQKILPNGNRAGFFIGDAAGVGKGRQIAGIILDNFCRGRTKHIWFSISADLKEDAQRDLNDIGCYIKVIKGCQELDKNTKVFGLPKDFEHGVVFSTYATLISSTSKGGGSSRLDQLIRWCGGEEFSGCLIFDECHKAKHFDAGNENRSTKVGDAVGDIQGRLPKARVLYCSATGVADVKNMGFMERLGLWGEGATFSSFNHFCQTVKGRELGVAEMVAMEMKASGMYVSRGLSFKQAEFVTVEMDLTPKQVHIYDKAAHVWSELRSALETALGRTNSSDSRVWSQYGSCHQRFFKQLSLGMKVPKIVEETQKALADGFCVVIGLQTTGEASMDSQILNENSTQFEFVSVAREILTRFIKNSFPTLIFSDTQAPLHDDWSQKAKDILLQFAKKIELPPCPLDEIVDQLGGPTAVAEMTGRQGRIVRCRPGGQPCYQRRIPDNSADVNSMNVQERKSFMSGKKLVAIISDAASTGISLHADSRVANQRRRLHITMELPWSADKAVQQMGRSHRANQTSGPLYKLLTTNLGGERRFAAAVAKRLQTMGALTQGDRRAATGADLSQFNFDTAYGRGALNTMYTHIFHGTLAPGVSLSSICPGEEGGGGEVEFSRLNATLLECLSAMRLVEEGEAGPGVSGKNTKNVGRFLNRILGLTVARQNLIFNYFYECLQATIAMAKKEGKYSEGLVDIKASSVEMVCPPKTVFKEASTSTPTQLLCLSVDRGMSWEAASERLERFGGGRNGFYCSRREHYGKKAYVLATKKEDSAKLFKIARPNTGISPLEEKHADLTLKYRQISKEDAEVGWKEQYEATKDKCIHGSHCKKANICKVGARHYRMDLLCGGIVTLLSILEDTVTRYAEKLDLSKDSYSMKVVRVALNNQRPVIGIRYPECLVERAEETLQEKKLFDLMQAEERERIANVGSHASQVPISVGRLLTMSAHKTPRHVKDLGKPETPVELETPVDPACTRKALTAPLTLRSFFKATPRTGSGENRPSPAPTSAATVEEGRSISRGGDKNTGEESPKSVLRERVEDSEAEGQDDDSIVIQGGETKNDSTPLMLNGTPRGKVRPPKEVRMEEDPTDSSTGNGGVRASNAVVADTTQETLIVPPLQSTGTESSVSGTSLSIPSSQSEPAGSQGTKRPLADVNGRPVTSQQPASKKRRPPSGQKVATPAAKSALQPKLTCPVCDKQFPKGTWLAEFNKHIDDCLK